MPVPVQDVALAASPGSDGKRTRARRAVALAFFQQHVYEADPKKDWNVVRRALQCIDYDRPVVFGPMPPAPSRLLAVSAKSPLGKGFFREVAGRRAFAGEKQEIGEWWTVSPEAVYMKFFAPTVGVDVTADPPSVRYFIPGARNAKGKPVVIRERG